MIVIIALAAMQCSSTGLCMRHDQAEHSCDGLHTGVSDLLLHTSGARRSLEGTASGNTSQGQRTGDAAGELVTIYKKQEEELAGQELGRSIKRFNEALKKTRNSSEDNSLYDQLAALGQLTDVQK